MNRLFTIVPILEEWDTNRVVGELKILTAALPPFPDYHFALGYKTIDGGNTYTLMCISPINDTLRKVYE